MEELTKSLLQSHMSTDYELTEATFNETTSLRPKVVTGTCDEINIDDIKDPCDSNRMYVLFNV